MRILTFNWHETYIALLAKTGHQFDVVEREKGGCRTWFYEMRPVPRNVHLVRESTARRGLRDQAYDVVVCQNARDLHAFGAYRVPKALVFHNRLTTELGLGGHADAIEARRAQVRAIIDISGDVVLVFISHSKREDWGLDGVVIPPGIDLDEYGGYVGEDARVLRVGNFLKARDLMLGYSAQCEILGDLPSTILGLNRGEKDARLTTSWDDLKACFRSYRLFLNSTVDGYEDGYNLAMLEAMATGMPVISTANRTSPLEDGRTGYVSSDFGYLRAQVERLLADRELAGRIGAEGRKAVREHFPLDRFVERWDAVFALCQRRHMARLVLGQVWPARVPAPSSVTTHPAITDPAGADRGSVQGRRRILLSYVSYPATTARYLEASLRKRHDVITLGPTMDQSLIDKWDLHAMRESVTPHNLPCDATVDLEIALRPLFARWLPDLFLWIESVPGFAPQGIASLPCATACYLIDSHLNLEAQIPWARQFDWVFVAQRECGPVLREAGCQHVSWLPLGCDPAVHRVAAEGPPQYDIGFVGSLGNDSRRTGLLDRLRRRFDVHVERVFLHDMARVFASSRIVFNNAVRNDLNMRVFEALASGAMLLTDRASGSGLEEMFADRRHLVLYDDDTLEDLAAYYLAHDREREAIAARGCEEVLRWHTYDHRAAALVETVFGEGAASDPATLCRPVTDPILLQAIHLAGTERDADALARLALVFGHRDLQPLERYVASATAASCLERLGARAHAFGVTVPPVPASDRLALAAVLAA